MPSGKLDDRRSPGPIIAMHCSPEGSEPIFTFTFTEGSESIFTFTEGSEPIFTFKRLLQPTTSKPWFFGQIGQRGEIANQKRCKTYQTWSFFCTGKVLDIGGAVFRNLRIRKRRHVFPFLGHFWQPQLFGNLLSGFAVQFWYIFFLYSLDWTNKVLGIWGAPILDPPILFFFMNI